MEAIREEQSNDFEGKGADRGIRNQIDPDILEKEGGEGGEGRRTRKPASRASNRPATTMANPPPFRAAQRTQKTEKRKQRGRRFGYSINRENGETVKGQKRHERRVCRTRGPARKGKGKNRY